MDDLISFPCESCRQVVTFPAARRGHVEECPHCGGFLDVPSASSCAQPAATSPQPLPAGVWWEFAAVMGLAVLPSIYYSAAEWYWGAKPYTFVDDALAEIVSAIQKCLPILVLLRLTGQEWRQFGLVRFCWWLDGFAALVVLRAGQLIPYTVILVIAPTGAHIGIGWPHPQGIGEHALLLLSCAASGFSQELVMRGYLITRLERLCGSTTCALMTSSVFFALWHTYQGLSGVLETGVNGLVYGAIYCATRRLWPLAIAHALHNIMAISG